MLDASGAILRDFNIPTQHAVVSMGPLWTLTRTQTNGIGQLGLTEFGGLVPTFAPHRVQTAMVTSPERTSVACPALAVTLNQDVAVGFTTASPAHYASAYITGRRSYDPPGTLRPVQKVATGQAPFYPLSGQVIRMDYCDAATTPKNDTLLFALNYSGRFDLVTRVIPVIVSQNP